MKTKFEKVNFDFNKKAIPTEDKLRDAFADNVSYIQLKF